MIIEQANISCYRSFTCLVLVAVVVVVVVIVAVSTWYTFRVVYTVVLIFDMDITQTDLGVLQRATEGLQQRLEEAEKDKRQASELHSSNTSKVCIYMFLSFLFVYFLYYSVTN